MVTIFTAVYNRRDLLLRLYNSIKNQTDMNFEWIVVDDGSTDGVYDVLLEISEQEKDFSIKCLRVPNGGKHRAINLGVKMASGDAFFIVDSDDVITKNAIELIRGWWQSIRNNKTFAGISGQKAHFNGNIVGNDIINEDFIDANNFEREKYGLSHDKAEVYRTDLLREFSFPEFEGENFVTEAVVWNAIAYAGYKIRWFKEVIYYCEYLEGGLSDRGMNLFIENPMGWGKYIGDNYKYGLVTYENIYDYWLTVRERLTWEQIEEVMCLSEEVMSRIKAEFSDKEKLINNRVGNKAFAIYGMGTRGRKLYSYCLSLEFSSFILMDKQLKEYKGVQVFTIEEVKRNKVRIENICVSIKNVSNSLIIELEKAFPNADVWLFDDI